MFPGQEVGNAKRSLGLLVPLSLPYHIRFVLEGAKLRARYDQVMM